MADDIKVRLSPEGQAEVIEALRRVQNEARRSGAGAATRDAARGVGLMNQALRDLQGLLPTIGLAAFATGAFLAGKRALDTAEHINKLQQRLGATAEEISTLRFGALLADVQPEALEGGLARLTRAVGDLRRGTGEQTEAFAELGLTARDFIGKNAVQAFELVASRIAAVEDPLQKAKLTLDLFGRSGAGLIPLLNAVGTQGLAPLRAEAERVGLIFSSDLAKAAEDVNDQFKLIGQRVNALAIEFSSGFAPAIADALAVFRQETEGRGVNAMVTLGEAVGKFGVFATKTFLILAKTIGAVLAVLEDKVDRLGRTTLEITKQALAGAATGGVVGAAAGSVLPGVGTVGGGAVGVAAGGLFGGLRGLVTPSSRAQADILADLRKEIVEILEATDPAKLSPHADALKKLLRAGDGGAGEGGGTVGFSVRERLAALTKRLNLEALDDLKTFAKEKDRIDRDTILAERRVADARIAANAQTLEGQRAIATAEAELNAAKARQVEESARLEIAAVQAREALTVSAIRRQFGETQNAQRLIAETVRQSSREQLAIEQGRYAALVTLQENYLKQVRAAKTERIALDKEVAENARGLARFQNQNTLASLGTEEEKKQFTAKLANEKLDELRSEALVGNVEKARELRQEILGLANDLSRLGAPGFAERVFGEANDLFDLAGRARKLAGKETEDAAQKAADAIQKQLDELKGRIDQFKANLIFDIAPVLSAAGMAQFVRDLQDALNKQPFQITLQAQANASLDTQARAPVLGGEAFAQGGLVGGYSPSAFADNIHAMLTAGEYVMRVPAVEHYGAGFMRAINAMQLPRFAEGGLVGAGAGAGGGDEVTLNLNLGSRRARLSGSRDSVRALTDALIELDQDR